eukprot:gene5720-7902_t
MAIFNNLRKFKWQLFGFFITVLAVVAFYIGLTYQQNIRGGANAIKPNQFITKIPYVNVTTRVVGFYHIFTSFNQHEAIINEQINHLKTTGGYNVLSSVRYTVIGDHDYKINDTKFIHSAYLTEGHEEHTLAKVYDFCISNPTDFVLYFHPKGSFSPKGSEKETENRKFRKVLNYFVLHTYCYKALLNGFDVCGARLSTLPYLHYSGNFWWARCTYVNTLIDPRKMSVGSELQIKTLQLYDLSNHTWCFGGERFFSEAWIGSGPNWNGADCIPGEREFLYGWSFPENIMILMNQTAKCPLCYDDQIRCGTAATNDTKFVKNNPRDPKRFSFYHQYWDNLKDLYYNFQCATLEKNIARANLWYDKHPIQNALIKIRAKYDDFPGKNISKLIFDHTGFWNLHSS